jgi:hypothetical protein
MKLPCQACVHLVEQVPLSLHHQIPFQIKTMPLAKLDGQGI